MRKFLAILVLVLCPTSFCPTLVLAEVVNVLDQTNEEWTKASSVFVCKKYNGSNGCGSGTVIHTDKEGYLVLTCYHVARPDQEGKIVIRPAAGGEERPGTIVSTWQAHDMAVIRVDDAKYKVRAAKVAKQVSYAQGLTVCKCGYPGAGPRHVASGTCMGTQTTGNGVQDWYSVHYRVLTRSGDSGGGLFRESDHALIGIVWGASQGLGYATRVESIWKMIDSLKESGWLTDKADKVEKLLLTRPPQSVLACDR